MSTPALFQRMFAFNAELIRNQNKLLDDAESLVRWEPSGQCYNWVLGHIISTRFFPLNYLGGHHVWSDATRQRYRNGNPGHFSPTDPAPFSLSELVGFFDQTQTAIDACFATATAASLAQPSGFGANTISESLVYFNFHETHHAGQLLSLAQNVGKPGAWLG